MRERQRFQVRAHPGQPREPVPNAFEDQRQVEGAREGPDHPVVLQSAVAEEPPVGPRAGTASVKT